MVRDGTCAICGTAGEVQGHHIISQAKIKRLKQGQYGYDLNLLRNPRNLIDLCLDCHSLTDSHVYYTMHRELEKMWDAKKPEMKRKQDIRVSKWAVDGTFQCSEILNRGYGRRCNMTVKVDGGKCGIHSEEGVLNRKAARSKKRRRRKK